MDLMNKIQVVNHKDILSMCREKEVSINLIPKNPMCREKEVSINLIHKEKINLIKKSTKKTTNQTK
jgi:hypothetical protein